MELQNCKSCRWCTFPLLSFVLWGVNQGLWSLYLQFNYVDYAIAQKLVKAPRWVPTPLWICCLQLCLRPLKEHNWVVMALGEDRHFRTNSFSEELLLPFLFFPRLFFVLSASLPVSPSEVENPSLYERSKLRRHGNQSDRDRGSDSVWGGGEEADRREDRILAFHLFIYTYIYIYLQAKSWFFYIFHHVHHSCSDGPYFGSIERKCCIMTFVAKQLWSPPSKPAHVSARLCHCGILSR